MDPTNAQEAQQPGDRPGGRVARDGRSPWPWVAVLFVLDLAAWLALPVAVGRLRADRAWWQPLALGAVLRFIRGTVSVVAAERTLPMMSRVVGDLALSRGDPEDLGTAFMAVWVGARAADSALPGFFAGVVSACVAAVLAARTLDPWILVAVGVAAAGAVGVRRTANARVQSVLDASVAARTEASHWLSAASRGRFEITGSVRAGFLSNVADAGWRWAVADRVYVVARRGMGLVQLVTGGAIVGIAVVGTGGWTALHTVVPWLALAAVAAPALAASRAAEELLALRRTRDGLLKLPTAPAGTTELPTDADTVVLAGVTVRYGDALALDDVSLTLPLRGVTAVVGPNGAGKSTLAQVVAGRRAPDQGTCTAGGVPMTGITPDSLAMVPQQPCVVDALSVGDNVRLVAPDATDDAVETALRALGLKVRADHRAGALSRGEQRRIAVARALLRGPRVVVLDEPDAWLDRAGRDVLATVLRSEGMARAVVLVTHRADLVRWVDRVVVLGATRKVEAIGTYAEVSQHPAWRALQADAAG